MLIRLLTLLITVITVPALAQQRGALAQQRTPNTNATTATATVAVTTPATFEQQKAQIDSLIQVADTMQSVDHAAFTGRARAGKYRVECLYNTPTKELLKTNFIFITDSLNFRRIYYYKGNSVIKIEEVNDDNNNSTYYQVGDHLFNDQGSPAAAAKSKSLMDVITYTFKGLYAGLFP
jgi:hypothetical protein